MHFYTEKQSINYKPKKCLFEMLLRFGAKHQADGTELFATHRVVSENKL